MTPQKKAIQVCAVWLQYCLRLGWSKDSLDALETLWWKYHDENGNLISLSSSVEAGTAEQEHGNR